MTCAKYECSKRAEQSLTIMPGVTINVCKDHLDWAWQVARTGRA